MENKTILLVEDDLDLQKELKEYLEIYFDIVYCASNGKTAYEIYLQNKPQAIITDINLPIMNGLNLIEKIRQKDNTTPIVVLSAYTNNEYLLKAIELNLITYMIKPISSKKLKETIQKTLNQISGLKPILLNNNYSWNEKTQKLFYKNEQVSLSSYETLLIKCLCENLNSCVSYVDLHYAINPDLEFSKNSLTSLIKRVRQKTSKNFIESCYMQGYKIIS